MRSPLAPLHLAGVQWIRRRAAAALRLGCASADGAAMAADDAAELERVLDDLKRQLPEGHALAAVIADEERAGDHDEDEGEAYEDEEGGAVSEDEEEEEDDEEVGGDSKESDRDREMHAIQGLPCVPIGGLLEFPSRKEHGKRLSQSFDHWNTRSWTGDVDLRNANLVRDWATGFCNSHGKLLATGAVAQPRDPRKMASVQKYAKGRGLFV